MWSIATARPPVCGERLTLLVAVGARDSSDALVCEGDDFFLPTPYGSVNSDNRCDNGVTVYRECSAEGVWGAITYSGLCGESAAGL